MPNRMLNFCYNIAAKREDMEVAEQDNPPRDGNIRQRRKKREEARKAYAKRLNDIKKHNSAVKLEAYRGVRRPGRDHTRLFQTLELLVGSLELKKQVLREVISEALRFKRQALAKLLEEYVVKLEMPVQPVVCQQCALIHVPSSTTCKGRNIG